MRTINWNRHYQTHENPATTGTTYEQDGKMYNNNGVEVDGEGNIIEDGRDENKLSGKPIDAMTVAELRDVAARIPGITGVGRMNKQQLLGAIANAK